MTESSRPWQDAVGDGGPYNAATQWAQVLETLGLAVGANVGVVSGIQNELAVTSSGNNNATTNTGRALVEGILYENDASESKATASPVVGTTGRRVVLRADYSARTVRIVIITSSDGTAALPALTQAAGVTWEIPLRGFTITTGGVITLGDDERELTRAGAIPAGAFISRASLTRWARPGWSMNAIGTQQLNGDQIHFTPILIQEKRTFDRLGCEVTTLTAGQVTRLGIYNARHDPDGLVPSSLVVDGGVVSVASTGNKEVTISEELTPGWYFLAQVTESLSPNFRSPLLAGVVVPVTGRSATQGAVQDVVLATATDAGADYSNNGLPDPAVAVTLLYDATYAAVQLRDSS